MHLLPRRALRTGSWRGRGARSGGGGFSGVGVGLAAVS